MDMRVANRDARGGGYAGMNVMTASGRTRTAIKQLPCWGEWARTNVAIACPPAGVTCSATSSEGGEPDALGLHWLMVQEYIVR